jgi:hypothetical protein
MGKSRGRFMSKARKTCIQIHMRPTLELASSLSLSVINKETELSSGPAKKILAFPKRRSFALYTIFLI